MPEFQLTPPLTGLSEGFAANATPIAFFNASWAVTNTNLCREWGLPPEDVFKNEQLKLFSSQSKLPHEPKAMIYAGHQFGHFNPSLGDGRACLLGEYKDQTGQTWDIHLKGSGPTQFSRGGDGLAALGPMLREALISEFMHSQNIPTTRALAVLFTNEYVRRQTLHPGAILVRGAHTHFRVGSIEALYVQNKKSLITPLLQYLMKRLCLDFHDSDNLRTDFVLWLLNAQSRLISQWMRVGFVHGVMNTDNMSLSGETIDYGPCAFMDHYKSSQKFSSIDRSGRYAFDQQAKIALWNLSCLHECLELRDFTLQDLEHEFSNSFHRNWQIEFGGKFGFAQTQASDESLILEFLNLLEIHGLDFTNSFLSLEASLSQASCASFDPPALKSWIKKWHERLKTEATTDEKILSLMRQKNPRFIPRNHIIEELLNNAEKTHYCSIIQKILEDFASNPNPNHETLNRWAAPKHVDPNFQTFCGT